MKIKLLALAVTGVLLSGCGNDSNGTQATFTVQAYDPAIYLMDASASCTDGTTGTAVTDRSGNASFTETTIVTAPETCTFTMVGGANAIDVSNQKSMTGVNYDFPKGLAQVGSPATVSPLTTLITKELGGASYSEATASTVLTNLGLNTLVNAGVTTISNLLLNTQSVVTTLENDVAQVTNFQLLSSTTSVLTDILEYSSTSTVAEITAATTFLAPTLASTFEQGKPNKVVINQNAVIAIVASPTQQTVTDLPADDKPNTTDGTALPDPTGSTGSTGSTGATGSTGG